jgi:hypothetical protein
MDQFQMPKRYSEISRSSRLQRRLHGLDATSHPKKSDADLRMEAITKGRQKRQDIENQRPKTERERIASNQDVFQRYSSTLRYKSRVFRIQ